MDGAGGSHDKQRGCDDNQPTQLDLCQPKSGSKRSRRQQDDIIGPIRQAMNALKVTLEYRAHFDAATSCSPICA